jgi:hypothetical protein
MIPPHPVTVGSYEFRAINSDGEMKEVHHLNYNTFVIEIPQHTVDPSGFLIDKFHDKNLYFGAFRNGILTGMISVHSQPPFSITDRLSDPSLLDHLQGKPLEVRLLAVLPSERHGIVFAGLGWQVYRFAKAGGFTHLLISGLVERESLYQRLGFRAVGEPVGKDGAAFVPMILSLDEMPPYILKDIDHWESWMSRIETVYEVPPL